MDEQEWLGCTDPEQMLEFLRFWVNDPKRDGMAGRKLRLFAVASARRVWHLLPEEASRQAVEALERFAEGLATREDLYRAKAEAFEVASQLARDTYFAAFRVYGITEPWDYHIARQVCSWDTDDSTEQLAKAQLLRDLFGPLPFRPVALDPAWLAWNDGTVVKLAQAVYDQRAFERLPILADALEEAGCTSAEVLDHLRGPGPHVRGCWPVDLILAKK